MIDAVKGWTTMSESMPTRERLQDDLKTAMRERNDNARDTIRFILSAIKNAEIEQRGALSQPDAVAVLQRQAKQRQEAIEQFRAGGREDLAGREERQLAVLKRYLPVELSDDEVVEMTKGVIAETGAATLKDMSKVMPVLMQRAAGRADGKRLSAAVKTLLSGA
ncbi:MAG: GatB/YqeY domain-containing protein [Propionibacteriaceae bacterium]|nr:GatB/YqeY domain-containing protein [Propionibacteriaceae bacterium]